MKKTSLVVAMIILLVGAPVQAQKKNKGGRVSTQTEVQNLSIQDDNGGGYFIFNPVTGAFKCNMCEYGYSLSGVGAVKVDGCNVYFSAVSDSYNLFVSVNACDQQGKAALEVLALPDAKVAISPVRENWTDSDMRNSVTDCAATPAENLTVKSTALATTQLSEFIVQNDADGSFLVFNKDTGAYKFVHCEDGSVLSGTGNVKIDGCNLYLDDIRDGFRVLASINVCAMEGKAAVEVFTPLKTPDGVVLPLQEFISDSNLTDNTTQCGAKK